MDERRHEELREDLALYASGELEEAEAAVTARHLERCSECRDELEALKGTIERLRDFGAPTEVAVDLSGIRAESLIAPRRSWFRSRLLLQAAALLLAFLAGIATQASLTKEAAKKEVPVVEREQLAEQEKVAVAAEPQRLQRAYLVASRAESGLGQALLGLSALMKE